MNETATTSFKEPTKRVGLRIPRWATQNRAVVKGIVEYLREIKEDWIIDADLDTEGELPPNTIDADWNGNALIVFRCSEREAKIWRERGIHVVNISSETKLEQVPSVIPDNHQMGSLAADYLMSLGLRRFAYVGEVSRRYSKLRQAGFEETLKQNGFSCQIIDLQISQILKEEKWSVLHQELNKAMESLKMPVGVLARDDIVAMNVLRSTRALGIKVPNEIALIGINDSMPHCHIATPNLTSVRHPGSAIGYHAARMLHAMMLGEDVEKTTLLPSEGIAERESTNIIAVEDPLVAKAIAYIRKQGRFGVVNVSDICRQLGVSNTTLRLRFKSVLGHSAKEEIDRVRHKEVSALLTETSSSIQEIAYHLGFNSPEELTRFFTRMQGIPPTKFRNQQ